MTAALLFAALGARAEILLGTDPLSRQIMTKTSQENGGVTAAVRVGTGQTIELKLDDMSSAPFPAQMAPASSSPVLPLKPAAGLAPKSSRTKKKAPRRAVDQLKHVSASDKSWGDKR